MDGGIIPARKNISGEAPLNIRAEHLSPYFSILINDLILRKIPKQSIQICSRRRYFPRVEHVMKQAITLRAISFGIGLKMAIHRTKLN